MEWSGEFKIIPLLANQEKQITFVTTISYLSFALHKMLRHFIEGAYCSHQYFLVSMSNMRPSLFIVTVAFIVKKRHTEQCCKAMLACWLEPTEILTQPFGLTVASWLPRLFLTMKICTFFDIVYVSCIDVMSYVVLSQCNGNISFTPYSFVAYWYGEIVKRIP